MAAAMAAASSAVHLWEVLKVPSGMLDNAKAHHQ
jgi:hypothetical protein